MATLKIQGGGTGRIRTVLGMDLGKGGFDNHGLALTDFPTFLEHSNNRYALALMMLAYRDPAAPAAPPRPTGAWLRLRSLEGRSRTDVPPSPCSARPRRQGRSDGFCNHRSDEARPGRIAWPGCSISTRPGRRLSL
ncbi:hypothetical protein ACRAWD_27400 [Caulobacter segnis]